jgi:hypothetical protein
MARPYNTSVTGFGYNYNDNEQMHTRTKAQPATNEPQIKVVCPATKGRKALEGSRVGQSPVITRSWVNFSTGTTLHNQKEKGQL